MCFTVCNESCPCKALLVRIMVRAGSNDRHRRSQRANKPLKMSLARSLSVLVEREGMVSGVVASRFRTSQLDSGLQNSVSPLWGFTRPPSPSAFWPVYVITITQCPPHPLRKYDRGAYDDVYTFRVVWLDLALYGCHSLQHFWSRPVVESRARACRSVTRFRLQARLISKSLQGSL